MESIHLKNFLVSPSTELSPFLADPRQLIICNGVNPSYKLGELRKDLGYSQIGDTLQANKAITGLFNFRQSESVQKMLATVNDSTDDDTQLFYSTGGAWTEITDAETAWLNKANIKVEMESFIGYCFFVGHGTTDGFIAPRTLTGTTFATTNTTSMPNAKYIKRYKDRLYIANTDISGTATPYRVYFSSVPSGATISWTVATDFLDVDYSEEITGLGEVNGFLVIFTQYGAYLYNQEVYRRSWDVGCSQNRTIQNVDTYLIWADRDNVWVSTGGRPEPLGNDILELLRNSSSSNWRSAVIDREYNLYVGNTSANGISYTNCLLTWNARTNMWRWRELFDSISSLARYYKTSVLNDFLWLGCSDGEVMEKSKYTDTTPVYTDDGRSIISHFRTSAYDFGDPSVEKIISKVMAYAKDGQGLNIGFRIFNKNHEVLNKFQNLGVLKKVINEFSTNRTIGNFIQFEGKEYSSNKNWIFYGFSALLDQETRL